MSSENRTLLIGEISQLGNDLAEKYNLDLENCILVNSIRAITNVVVALNEASFNKIAIIGWDGSLSIGDTQKTFNSLSKLLTNQGTIQLNVGQSSANVEFLKKVSKFAGLIFEETSKELYTLSKKVYNKQVISSNSQVKNGANGKVNPFAKAKLENQAKIEKVDDQML